MRNLLGLDLFGQKFSFTIIGEDKHKTLIGVILTLSLIILAVIFIFLFGSDFFNKTNPIINYQNVIAVNATKETLKNENFFIPWSILDSSSNPINTSGIIYPLVTYFSYDLINGSLIETQKISLNYSLCGSKYEKLIPGVSNYFCLDYDSLNLSLGGGWDGTFVRYFEIDISYCPGQLSYDENINCTKIDDLTSFLSQGIYFAMFYADLNFQGHNIEQPLNNVYLNYYYQLGLGLSKIDRLHYEKAYIFDDQGFVLQDNKTSQIFYGKTLQSDFSYHDTKLYSTKGISTVIYSCNYYLDKNYDLYMRTYMKLQGLSAIVGGFLNMIQITCLIISKIYNRPSRDLQLITEIFEFKSQDTNRTASINMPSGQTSNYALNLSKNESLSKEKCKESPHQDIKNRFSYGVSGYVRKIDFTDDINELNKQELIKKIEIPSIISILKEKYYCRKCIKSGNLSKLNSYKIGLNYLNKRLDIIHYLKTLDIIDELRNIFFNDFQNFALDFKNKLNLGDSIVCDSITKKLSLSGNLKNSTEVCEYFFKKIRSNTMNEKDQMIFKTLDNNLKKIILKKK